MHICGEIQYKIDGTGENVHSDVCLEFDLLRNWLTNAVS